MRKKDMFSRMLEAMIAAEETILDTEDNEEGGTP